MDMEKISEFFYKRASKRVREKVDKSKLTHDKIYKPDHKQISRIINNNRNKNNPFLICDAVICNSYKDDETGKPIKCGLLEKLDFNSVKEILWGTDDEINSYLYDFFLLLWEEVCTPKLPYMIDGELYLCDYIPYAKYSTYWNILFSSDNKYPAITFGICEDTVFKEIDSAREHALQFLYHKCKSNFHNIFSSFAEKTDSFHKLDKVLKEQFIQNSFIPLINAHKPDSSSLGLRVRDLITADLSHCASIISGSENDNPYSKALINASSNYILALEDIQSENCSK